MVGGKYLMMTVVVVATGHIGWLVEEEALTSSVIARAHTRDTDDARMGPCGRG